MAAGGGLAGMVGAGGTIGSSSAEQSRAQLAYVIKRGVCPLLDVARQTFAEVLSGSFGYLTSLIALRLPLLISIPSSHIPLSLLYIQNSLGKQSK